MLQSQKPLFWDRTTAILKAGLQARKIDRGPALAHAWACPKRCVYLKVSKTPEWRMENSQTRSGTIWRKVRLAETAKLQLQLLLLLLLLLLYCCSSASLASCEGEGSDQGLGAVRPASASAGPTPRSNQRSAPDSVPYLESNVYRSRGR